MLTLNGAVSKCLRVVTYDPAPSRNLTFLPLQAQRRGGWYRLILPHTKPSGPNSGANGVANAASLLARRSWGHSLGPTYIPLIELT